MSRLAKPAGRSGLSVGSPVGTEPREQQRAGCYPSLDGGVGISTWSHREWALGLGRSGPPVWFTPVHAAVLPHPKAQPTSPVVIARPGTELAECQEAVPSLRHLELPITTAADRPAALAGPILAGQQPNSLCRERGCGAFLFPRRRQTLVSCIGPSECGSGSSDTSSRVEGEKAALGHPLPCGQDGMLERGASVPRGHSRALGGTFSLAQQGRRGPPSGEEGQKPAALPGFLGLTAFMRLECDPPFLSVCPFSWLSPEPWGGRKPWPTSCTALSPK